jgi:hypothetical protein
MLPMYLPHFPTSPGDSGSLELICGGIPRCALAAVIYARHLVNLSCSLFLAIDYHRSFHVFPVGVTFVHVSRNVILDQWAKKMRELHRPDRLVAPISRQ